MVAARSASPSSWRTRPRLGRPDSTSMLARWVSRSCVWRISVMSLPTPRKPSKRPAVSMIGSPAIEIQRGPRAVLQLHFEVGERLLARAAPAELGMAAEQRRQRMAEQRAGRAAEQRGHARLNVGDAISPSTCHSQPTPRCSYSCSSRLALSTGSRSRHWSSAGRMPSGRR